MGDLIHIADRRKPTQGPGHAPQGIINQCPSVPRLSLQNGRVCLSSEKDRASEFSSPSAFSAWAPVTALGLVAMVPAEVDHAGEAAICRTAYGQFIVGGSQILLENAHSGHVLARVIERNLVTGEVRVEVHGRKFTLPQGTKLATLT